MNNIEVNNDDNNMMKLWSGELFCAASRHQQQKNEVQRRIERHTESPRVILKLCDELLSDIIRNGNKPDKEGLKRLVLIRSLTRVHYAELNSTLNWASKFDKCETDAS